MNRLINLLFFFISIFVFNYITIGFYVNGDQEYYRLFYESVSNENFSNVLISAKNIIGSSEIIYPYLIFIVSNLQLDKDIFIASVNLLLIILLYISTRNSNNRYILFIFLVFSFYFLVLYFAAERLKFGFLFCFFAIFFFNNKLYKLLFIILSLLSHFQMLIFWYGYLLFILVSFFKKINTKIKIKSFLLIIPLIALIISSQYLIDINGLINKIKAYAFIASGEEFFTYLKAFILFFVIFLSTRKYKANHIFLFLSMLPFYFLFGGDRLNMVYFMLAIIFLLKEKKINYIYIYILLFYYLIKGLFFIFQIYTTGTGF